MINKNKAFTLIELLVVIAIIGILSGFVIISMNGATNAANDAKKKTNLDTIKKATIMLGVLNGTYPEEAGCTIGSCPNLDPLIEEYIPSVNEGTYTYESDGTSFKLSSTLTNTYSYQFDSSTNTYSTNAPVPGVCGSSNGANLSSIPTTNLCNVGVASTVSGSGPWNWTCAGTSGGADVSCATLNLPVAGTCGSKNGKYASTTPTGTEACATGTVTGMTGTYSWTCAGLDGGASSGACATVAANYGLQTYSTVGTYSWTVPAGVTSVDVFLVGGGAGGGWSGGGGGYTKTYKSATTGYRDGNAIAVTPGNSATIVVGGGGVAGSNGSPSSFTFNSTSYTANGGMITGNPTHGLGDGGSGGGGYCNGSCACVGSSDGGNGVSGYTVGGTGQGHTTREFGEATGALYAGGGAGCDNLATCGTGGAGGGGNYRANGTNGLGGGGGCYGGAGGSGVVIVKYVNNL